MYQFFLNGGTQAYIIRIVGSRKRCRRGTAGPSPDGDAQSPGLLGRRLRRGRDESRDRGRFRLQVFESCRPALRRPVLVESFENLSMSRLPA